jgi:TonB family protein
MLHKLILLTATFSLLTLVACTSDQKAPEQKQVTSPSLSESEPGIDDKIDVDEFPWILNRVNPVYPEDALKKGIEGTVWIKALVSKKGDVKKAVVIKGIDGSESLEKAAFDAAMQMTFKPALLKNQPVEMWVAIPFKFKLASGKE